MTLPGNRGSFKSTTPQDINKRITKQLAFEMKSKKMQSMGDSMNKAIQRGSVLGDVLSEISPSAQTANRSKATKSVQNGA